MSEPFRFDRAWVLPLPPAELWTVLTCTDRYSDWWSWLHDFDADGLVTGTTARCTIRSPLRYSLHCAVHLDDVEPPDHITTTVTGDLRGPARLDLRPHPDGSTARLQWSVTVAAAPLVALAVVARPAMEWAHDRVLAVGFEQFLQRAIRAGRGK